MEVILLIKLVHTLVIADVVTYFLSYKNNQEKNPKIQEDTHKESPEDCLS